MKNLWHDDIRKPPSENWLWARTNAQAEAFIKIAFAQGRRFEWLSVDHDLGLHNEDPDQPDAIYQRGTGEQTGVDLMKWLVLNPLMIPHNIVIHSWNPSGAERMAACLLDVEWDGFTPTSNLFIQPYRHGEISYGA